MREPLGVQHAPLGPLHVAPAVENPTLAVEHGLHEVRIRPPEVERGRLDLENEPLEAVRGIPGVERGGPAPGFAPPPPFE